MSVPSWSTQAHGVMDVCIANNEPSCRRELMEPYAKGGRRRSSSCAGRISSRWGIAVRTFPLLEPGRYIRHNSDALARAILSVWQEFRNR